jgi:ABC-2 type transport system permease protein
MGVVWTITKRELKSYFDSLAAYVLLILFLGFSGFFTWLYGNDIFIVGQASLQVFFTIAYWTLFFFIPALTMRLIAEERRTGTLELLMTKAVSTRELVLGKFFAALLLIAVALVCTAPYVVTLSNIGNLDSGSVICGYLGLMLMSASYLGIGIYASSLTQNQIVAFMISLLFGLCFHVIFGVMSNSFTGVPGQIFHALYMGNHFENIYRGVIDSRDIIYFISIAAVGLFLAETELNKRKISG